MATLSKLDKLNYSIGIIDKVTGPVNKVMAKINQLSQQTAAAQDQMMRGAATAVAGGYALARSLAPAIDQATALGEVKSLGVVDESLQKLNKTSLEFTANFGGNASDFVRSAYDIQSAMSGITGDELSKVTEISNVLAKATKADAATVTDYMGTMYGVFKDTADKMGKVKWAEDIAGITAKAVTDYKTDGKEMASAFSALGASSSAPIAEQIAILGRLQSTMSGSESATKLKAFEAGAGKAQKALGLNFTDSSGQLLPMVDILQLINDKTNGLTKQVDIDAIASAFGSAEASSLIKLLIKDIDGLDNQVKDLSNISGMANVAKMADDMKTPWEQLGGAFNSASIAMGQRLLPVVEPFVSMLASMFTGIVSLTEEFPFLSSVIATAVVGVVALMTAFGIATFAMGLYNYATKIGITLANAQIIVNKLWLASLWALRVLGFLSLIATVSAAAIAFGVFKTAMLAGQAATWLFNAALWANPLTWIVIAAVALIAAVAALIYYFDDITAAFNEWAESSTVFKYLKVAFDLLTLPLQLVWRLIKTIAVGVYDFFAPAFSAISSVVMGMVNAIGSAFSYVGNLLSSFGGAITGFFSGMGSSVSGFFTGIWQSAVDIIESLINYLTETFGFLGDFFGGIASGISGIFDGVSSFISAIADNGVLNSVISFFSDDEPAKVSNKVEQVTQAVQPQTMVMQSADQAYSRDYGQSVISKASAPAQQASSQYIALNSPINYAAPKVTAIVETEEARMQALAGQAAANDPVYSAQPKVMTEREAANDAFKFTSQRLPAVPTDSTAPLNLQAQARSQALINNAFPSEQNKAVTVANNNITNSANSPVYNTKQAQLVSVNQSTAPEPALPSVKTDQVITNTASNSAEKAQQISAEQQATAYKPKLQKSAYLQSLTNNSSNTNDNSNSSDSSKHISIETVNFKSDDLAQSFEQMMELAG